MVWLLAWAMAILLGQANAPAWAVLVLPSLAGLALAQWRAVAATRWRGVFVAAGFPVSALVLLAVQNIPGSGGPPAWLWLIPLGVLLLAYPMGTWRDAPLFPTPAGALQTLASAVPLPDGARVLDAGCGLGAGLRELRRAYPSARLHGTEWSRPLAALCRLRCPWALVRRGDMWAEDWSGFDLVYLFQRPESMPQAVDKARRELRPGAWLVSLEFPAPGLAPAARLELTPRRTVWVYRLH